MFAAASVPARDATHHVDRGAERGGVTAGRSLGAGRTLEGVASAGGQVADPDRPIANVDRPNGAATEFLRADGVVAQLLRSDAVAWQADGGIAGAAERD